MARRRACSAVIFAPRIWLPQITSRDLVLMAVYCSATVPDSQSTTASGTSAAARFRLVKRPAAIVGKCYNRWNSGPWRGVESSLPADAPKTLAGRRPPQVGGPGVGSLGPFRARWIVKWPCTSAALALRQMS